MANLSWYTVMWRKRLDFCYKYCVWALLDFLFSYFPCLLAQSSLFCHQAIYQSSDLIAQLTFFVFYFFSMKFSTSSMMFNIQVYFILDKSYSLHAVSTHRCSNFYLIHNRRHSLHFVSTPAKIPLATTSVFSSMNFSSFFLIFNTWINWN